MQNDGEPMLPGSKNKNNLIKHSVSLKATLTQKWPFGERHLDGIYLSGVGRRGVSGNTSAISYSKIGPTKPR